MSESSNNIYANRVPPNGPLNARIALIGEAPSYEEVNQGRGFVGPSGRELDRLLKDAGINRDQCWITNVCKFMVPPNGPDKKIPFGVRASQVGINLLDQLNELRVELDQIKPNIIVALGDTALHTLTGKSPVNDWRGSIINGLGHKLISTYHPAHLLHMKGAEGGYGNEYWKKYILIHDLKRALNESHNAKFNLPYRHLHIARSSADVIEFINRNKGLQNPAIDIEARYCIPICIGIAFTPHEGITIPLWNVEGISQIPENDLVQCWIILSRFLAQQDVIGQNFGYDRDKIKRLGFIIKSLFSDTMLKAFIINPELPKNLAFLQSLYTLEPFYKNEGMYEGTITDLLLGCARDACVTKEIDLAMDKDVDELFGQRKFYTNFVLKLHDLYQHIESVGFKVNEDKRDELLRKYTRQSETLEYQLFKIAGNNIINVNSPKQVAVFLYETLGIPHREGTGEEVLTQILNNCRLNENQKAAIDIILTKRRVDKTIGNNLMARPDFDGRMKTSYFVCLDTGRTSTTQLEPPIRPTLEYKVDGKGPLKKKPIGSAFQTMTKHGDIGADVRGMYEADEGCIFIQIDSSQAEARVVWLLADDEEALRMVDEIDYHALTSSWFFGGSEPDYSKKVLGYESPYRFAGKTLRHAGHLGASKKRAATEVNTQCRKYKINFVISEKDADIALKTFHAKQPKIKSGFQNGIIQCLADNRRTLTAGLPYGIDAECGGMRTFYERWGDELNRKAFSYIPQRTVSDNTKAAALRIRDIAPWIKIPLEAHDALLLMVPIERKLEAGLIGKQEMERPISFEHCSLKRRNLIIPAELEEGFNYKDLGKFKWHEVHEPIEYSTDEVLRLRSMI